ncbi:MAG: hypothetical protein DDT32_00432 [Syntrophomonadaceae bacterium]|nr:hypothetical protein [Bacillota bacterium]
MLAFFVFAAVFSLGVPYFVSINENQLSQRLFPTARAPSKKVTLISLLKRAPGRTSGNAATVRRLELAGHPFGMGVADFSALKMTLPLVVIALSIPIAILSDVRFLLLGLLMAGVANVLPEFLLGGWVKKRKRNIKRAIPSLMDTLALTVEAGLPLATAIEQAAHYQPGPLGDEFRIFIEETTTGRSRREAMQNLAARTDVDDLHMFSQTLIQAEKYGTPVGRTLRDLNSQFRTLRRNAIEERAQKASVKIIFPVAILILIPTLMLILGPLFLSMAASF